MLILSRNPDETICLGDDIEITVVEVRGKRVRIGIKAPKDLKVLRKEIYQTGDTNTMPERVKAHREGVKSS